MRTYVAVLAGRSPADVRAVVSSADPVVVEATLHAIREQARRETTADAPEVERARDSVERAVNALTGTPGR